MPNSDDTGKILRKGERTEPRSRGGVTATALRRGAMRLSRRLRSERAPSALSSTKLSVLGTLHRQGELPARALSDADRIQPQSLTRTLSALHADGLIARRPDPKDRRRSLISLTAAGREALARDMEQRDRWLEARLATLSPAERGILALAAELMERIAED
jgi:DNA-binding MarR family transcriptional regulator